MQYLAEFLQKDLIKKCNQEAYAEWWSKLEIPKPPKVETVVEKKKVLWGLLLALRP